MADQDDLIQRRDAAIDLARRYAQIDGGHHKTWVIDQMCRELLGNDYNEFVANTKGWDVGLPP